MVLAAFVAGCGSGGDGGPTVSADTGEVAADVSTSTNSADNVVTGTAVTVPFGQAMNPATIDVTLQGPDGTNVPGTVSMNAASGHKGSKHHCTEPHR